MKFDSGKFEGGYRLSYIHRTKSYLFLAQAVIILVFAVYLLLAGGGLIMKPFYLGINSFLFFVLIMLLIIVVEGFIFTVLEMRFIKSASTKFIVTQRGFRSSFGWVVVLLIVLMLFWLPLLPQAVEDNYRQSGSVLATSSVSPGTSTMFNTDAFGLTEVVQMDLAANGSVEVFIVTEDNYNLFKNSGKDVLSGYRINTDDYQLDSALSFEFPETTHARLYILAYSMDDTPVEIDYTITNNISSSMLTYIPLITLLFLVAHLVWVAYMFMINKRYIQGGIYR